MRKYIYYIIMLLCITSCVKHKELCYNHPEHAHRYHINVVADYRCDWEECYGGPDWKKEWPSHYINYESLLPNYPEGLRVVAYGRNNSQTTYNISTDGGVVTLHEGPNDILFYNNDTEYIIFSTDNSATTRATTRTRTRSTYLGSEFTNGDEPTLTTPDMLYANYYAAYVPEKVIEPTDFEVTLQPLVFKYVIRYEFDSGLEYVAMTRGALSGMASSVTLNTGETSSEPATLLYDCEKTNFGSQAVVTSFGIPSFPNQNYPARSANRHALNLEVLLRNGKTVNFNWDVTDQVTAQPHGGVIIVDGIVIPEDAGLEGSGAFDVTVNDWGEYEDVVLPI